MNHAYAPHATQPLVDALVAARQAVRVRLHHLSFDARNDWDELESQLDCLQSRIEYEGDRIKPSATGRVRELVETVTQFLREHQVADCSSY